MKKGKVVGCEIIATLPAKPLFEKFNTRQVWSGAYENEKFAKRTSKSRQREKNELKDMCKGAYK